MKDNKAELMAYYFYFKSDFNEITPERFREELSIAEKEQVSWTNIDSSTSVCVITTDGWDYMQFSSVYSVGWQGDHDCDNYFCARKTVTKAEMKEIEALLC